MMKRKIAKKAIITFVLMGFILMGINADFISAAVKKPALPTPVISHIGTSYLKGKRPYISISSSGYTKSVQYRLILTNDKTKKKTDVIKAYSKNYNPKSIVGVTLPFLDSGNYTLTLYVRRSGTRVSYDKYTHKKFSIINNSTAGGGAVKPPVEDKSPLELTYTGIVLKNKSVPMTKINENTYSVDLSKEDNSQVLLRIALTASKDCKLTTAYTSSEISLTKDVARSITISEFGVPDNPPEGVGFTTMRTLLGRALNLTINLKTSNGINSQVNLQIKL